jgi:hypothetical protein
VHGVGWRWTMPFGRPAVSTWSTASLMEAAAVLGASAALALLVAAAGNALPDAPAGEAAPGHVPVAPGLNPLEFCSGEGERRRCIVEAT